MELAFASWHLRGVSDCALAPDPGVESPLFLPHLNTVPLGAETPGIFLPLVRPAHRWLGHAQRGYALLPVRCPQHSHLSGFVSCPLRDSLLPLASLVFRVNNTHTRELSFSIGGKNYSHSPPPLQITLSGGAKSLKRERETGIPSSTTHRFCNLGQIT